MLYIHWNGREFGIYRLLKNAPICLAAFDCLEDAEDLLLVLVESAEYLDAYSEE